jgi:L-asparagine permease
VGTAAGETENPEKVMPKAINAVVIRIAVFYVGSLILLALLLPYTSYKHGESPFVTFFAKLGFTGAGSLMNLVVLTAAFSSLNAGLYSTGRILRSMAVNGSGPKFTAPLSRNGVPYGGILLTGMIGLLGVALNAVVPEHAFEIVLNIAALGVIAAWATIVACQLRFFALTKSSDLRRPAFRMPLAPYSGYATLAFLGAVLVLMMFDPEYGIWIRTAVCIGAPALFLGWYLVRGRVQSALSPAVPEQSPTVVAQPDPDE